MKFRTIKEHLEKIDVAVAQWSYESNGDNGKPCFKATMVSDVDAPQPQSIADCCADILRGLNMGNERHYTELAPFRIIKNNNAMIVFWADGTKTIVKRASDELDSDYAAFTAALGIKCFGSNSALKRIVARTETQKPKKQKDDTRYRIVCPVCGATFIKTPSEVRTKDGTVSTACPDCGKFITVDFE